MFTDVDQAVTWARELVPSLREWAREGEQLRQLSPRALDAFRAARLPALAAPTKFGGMGLGITASDLVAIEIGRGDGSAGWLGSLFPAHGWMLTMWSLEAQQECWSDHEAGDLFIASSYNVGQGRAEAAPGGAKLTGHWDFSSGSDEASWYMLAGLGPAGPGFHLVPRADVQVSDTWFTAGLAGSGSKDVIVTDVFVPEHRVLPFAQMMTGHSPGAEVSEDPYLRVPHLAVMPYTLASPCLGMAFGMIELFEQRVLNSPAAMGLAMGERALVQHRVGETSAAANAAYQVLKADLAEIGERGASGDEITLTERAQWRRNQGWIARTSVEVVNGLYALSGGHAVYLDNPLQRVFRDIHTASHHVALGWDSSFELYGQVRFGITPQNPFF
jgi:alkylation response protein AidB-like acyl-CoA dehydrogenase